MSAMIEEADEGGAQRPSGVSEEGIGNLAEVIAHLSEIAIGSKGELLPDAASLMALRRLNTRDQHLRDLVASLHPAEVNPAVWTQWLAGGEQPFEGVKPKSLKPSDQSTGRALERHSPKVKKMLESVAAAKVGVDAAQRRLEKAEENLARVTAYEKALIQFAVSEHLVSIMAPMFAMGPAWTVMRALSAHASDEFYEDLTVMVDPKKRELATERLRKERAQQTEELLSVLDLWSGDHQFELDLRSAIATVVDRYKKRGSERDREGMRSRGKDAIRNSVRPETTTSSAEILAGMARSNSAP